MSEPFIAEIRIFGLNFAPRNWAFCHGQLLPIAQNTALFALIGTTYGGDGRTTFGLPNLQGRAPMHPGRGPGLSTRTLGESGGTYTVTLSTTQVPNHGHTVRTNAMECSAAAGATTDPRGNYVAITSDLSRRIYRDVGPVATTDTPVGGGQAHENRQPFLALNFCIALVGLFPSRS
jgi:microcystin-dependent protein